MRLVVLMSSSWGLVIGMATSFSVFSLGQVADLDPTEGNGTAENASSIVGTTFGGPGNALADNIQTLTQTGNGTSTGSVSSDYDSDNNSANDQFSIDGGPAQSFDSISVYNATITYIDGTTATFTANVFQDTDGNLYLAPESSANADQTALEAQPIRSLTLDSLVGNTFNMYGDRQSGNYAVCFTPNVAVMTPQGERLMSDLRVGDLVTTMDNGPQPIRWIGTNHLSQCDLAAKPALRPVLLRKEVLGARRDLLVSPQHGLLLGPDNLVRAKHLVDVPKSHVRVAHGKKSVTYVHMMFDAHQVVFAEGVASESFFPGPMAQRMVSPDAFEELQALFPDVVSKHAGMGSVVRHYGATARAFLARKCVASQSGRAGLLRPQLSWG